jgi:hypothetical protein
MSRHSSLKNVPKRPTQDALVDLLALSPLPWTRGMIDTWFGRPMGVYLHGALTNGRLWRIEENCYTVRDRYGIVVRILTDDMIFERLGISL